MKIVKHPAFPDVQHMIEDDQLDEWKGQGWLPLLTAAQEQRLEELQRDVDDKHCPTCGATGDAPCLTASGNPAKHRHADRPE